MTFVRNSFYKFISKIGETNLVENTTGSGIYDKDIIMNLKKINDPYPYFRGLITELTDSISVIEFHQPLRKYGKTKNNFYSLYDLAILGINRGVLAKNMNKKHKSVKELKLQKKNYK